MQWERTGWTGEWIGKEGKETATVGTRIGRDLISRLDSTTEAGAEEEGLQRVLTVSELRKRGDPFDRDCRSSDGREKPTHLKLHSRLSPLWFTASVVLSITSPQLFVGPYLTSLDAYRCRSRA